MQLTVQIWRYVILTFLDSLKTLYEGEDFDVMRA
jgi:hypothetical protein